MKIIDIPYSVVRIGATQFQYDRKVAVTDVLGFVPGVFLQSRYGNHDVRISIRGFGSRSNSGIRGVRILLDGIPESEPDGQTRIEAIDFNSVGNIEIVKGNSSSLYTNAPGGVINFINDIDFPRSFATSFNEIGSFNLRRSGIKAGVRTDRYRFLFTYSYHNFFGYRDRSEDYWHILNTVFRTSTGDRSSFEVLGYFVDGFIRLPGSLKREELHEDPRQSSIRESDFDFRRISTKGRLGLRFSHYFSKNTDMEVTGYGTLKYFERTARNYRIINRFGVGNSVRIAHRVDAGPVRLEAALGGDFYLQGGPIETYTNINGAKSDILTDLTNESIGNAGSYLQTSAGWNVLTLILTLRYDKVVFQQLDQLLASRNDTRRFEAWTPKAAINVKIAPSMAGYASYGLGFDTPAGNELDNFLTSTDPGKLMNPDLNPQNSKNGEIGIKGNLLFENSLLSSVLFEVTAFQNVIRDEIVPFEVFGDVFFRNSAQTTRKGIEIGSTIAMDGGIRFKTAYTFSDFLYDSYAARTVEFDSLGNITIRDRRFSDKIVPSVPKHNLTTALILEHPIVQQLTGYLKIQYQYVSGLYVDDANTDQTDGYTLWNTSTGFELGLDNFNLLVTLGINNTFDTKYVGFVNINSASRRFFEPGEPRSVYGGIRLTLNL
jgi:iron complex outermembrane recepter protein